MENFDTNIENELRLYSTSKIEDLKPEKIAFVIDLYEEVKNEDFLSIKKLKTKIFFQLMEIQNYQD